MKKGITFRMLAYTDSAGKYNPDAPRNGNEDNFYVDDDLGDDKPSNCQPDVEKTMSDCGLLMVVADGMGGQNAGEVASQIAIDTVAEYFAPKKITEELASSHAKRQKYMESVIVEADKRIKRDSKNSKEHGGMGSTIIMAWIVGEEMTLCWCGDSRAYRYNPEGGIELLSKDHSYVQELVDEGKIPYEATFDHPQNNIVTRSLGDSSKKALPDTKLVKLYNNDIILLCSDGLSGVLRDRKTKDYDGCWIEGDNLEDVISNNHDTLKSCREALWEAAEKADWYDNVTAVFCQITAGAESFHQQEKTSSTTTLDEKEKPKGFLLKLTTKGILLFSIFFVAILAVAIGITWRLALRSEGQTDDNIKNDTIAVRKSTDSVFVVKKDSLISFINGIDISKLSDSDRGLLAEMKDSIERTNDINDIDSLIRILEKIVKSGSKVVDSENRQKDVKQEKNKGKKGKTSDSQVEKTVDNELTPIANNEIKIVGYTVQKADTYKSFCQQVKNQYPNYIIQKIMYSQETIHENNFDVIKDGDDRKVTVVLEKVK